MKKIPTRIILPYTSEADLFVYKKTRVWYKSIWGRR